MKQPQKGYPFLIIKGLLLSYILTAVLLLLLALLLYKLHLGESVVAIAIIAVYVISTFTAGLMAGKKMKNKRFLWGLLMGIAYFVVLALVSLGVNSTAALDGNHFLTTLCLCAGGGMIGGMISW